MNNAIGISTICLFLINIICASASGKVILATLDQMTKESELIVIGKVNDIERTATTYDGYGNEYRAKIGIEKILKGLNVNEEVLIYYFPKMETSFIVGEKYIFFIRTWKGKYRMVRGYAGKVGIKDNKAKPSHIVDEDETQELEQFIQKITNCVRTEQEDKGVRP